MGEFKDSFVWRSTGESRAAGTLSILAVFETVGCTLSLWWLVAYTGWTFLLLSSVVLAFLMLLRSPQSVAMGVERFDRFMKAPEISKTTKWIVTAVALVVSFCVSWGVAQYWLVGYSGVSLFWRSTVLGLIAMTSGFAVMGVLTGAGVGAAAAAVMAAGTAAAAGVAAITGMAAFAGVVAIAVVGMAVVVSPKNRVAAALFPEKGMVAVMGTGLLSGIYLRVISIRFLCVVQNFGHGLRNFSTNWLMLISSTDSFSAPELMPGLPKQHRFNMSTIWNKARNQLDTIDFIMSSLAIPIFFAPALLYRFYLKSTAWIYLPLILMAYVPPIERAAEGRLVWDKAKGCTKLDRLFSLSAWVGLALLVTSVTNITEFIQAALETKTDTTIFTPWLFFLSMDLTALRGWQGLLITSSAVTLGLYYWADDINTKMDRRDQYTPAQSTLWIMRKLTNFKTLLTLLWVLGTIYALFYHLYHHGGLPDFMNIWLGDYWG